MNQNQIKYLRQRAEEIYNKKITSLTTKFTRAEIRYDATQVYEALKSGNFVVNKPKIASSATHYLRDVITFPEEVTRMLDTEGLNLAKSTLKLKYDALLDELMLGDSDEAIQMLKAFETVE